jgi:hypothetical protein
LFPPLKAPSEIDVTEDGMVIVGTLVHPLAKTLLSCVMPGDILIEDIFPELDP